MKARPSPVKRLRLRLADAERVIERAAVAHSDTCNVSINLSHVCDCVARDARAYLERRTRPQAPAADAG